MELKDKVRHALDESRMLVMGVQVLLGFTYQPFLMRRFDRMPAAAHHALLGSTAFLLLATMLLLAPAARHRLLERGRDTQSLIAFARRMSALAIVLFALSLGIHFFIVVCRAISPVAGAIAAAAASVTALLVLYVIPRTAPPHPNGGDAKEPIMETPSLNDEIKQVMIEHRVVLPGTQALLGFQFAAVLQDGFDDLPAAQRLVHVGGLAFLGASVVLLMLPAAFHRIAEKGEISDRLLRLSARALLAAMTALAAGLACDTFIVVTKALGSSTAGLTAAAVWLLAAAALWFGYPILCRSMPRYAER